VGRHRAARAGQAAGVVDGEVRSRSRKESRILQYLSITSKQNYIIISLCNGSSFSLILALHVTQNSQDQESSDEGRRYRNSQHERQILPGADRYLRYDKRRIESQSAQLRG